jgi:hypothetical protein
VLRTGTGAKADYLLPLKVLYVHDQIHHIALGSVQAVAPEFLPQQGEWYPLNLELYRDLVHWPV